MPIIAESFGDLNLSLRGITMKDPPAQTFKRNNRFVPNPKYVKKDASGHYFDENGYLYCARLSELVLQVTTKNKDFIRRIVSRLNKFFDHLFIDEFQDYRNYDYELILAIAKLAHNTTLVGDYYQHSVLGRNNSGKPFVSNKKAVSYDDFCANMRKEKLEIDESSLCCSRRCSLNVCTFINKKLGIPIISADLHQGDIKLVKREEVIGLLKDDSVKKLVWSGSNSYPFNSINWSKSKGNTYSRVCIILTKKLDELCNESFSLSKQAQVTINKLYVALTRSSGDVFLVKNDDFKNAYESEFHV